MSFAEAVRHVFDNFAVARGRARRSEYWNFFLFCLLVQILARIVDIFAFFFIPFLGTIFTLALIIPSITVSIRRLHDTNKSGAYLFLVLIPLVGSVILLIWFCTDSDRGDNLYGPSPKYPGPGIIIPPGDNPPGKSRSVVVARRYAVLGVTGPLQGQVFPVDGNGIEFGRDASCRVRFPQGTPGVSGRHAMASIDGTSPYLMDLGSTYGTFMADGRRLQERYRTGIVEGDEFYFGARENRFRLITYST